VSLTAFYLAASIVTLMQYVRLRDHGALPLLAMFLCLFVAHAQSDWFAARPWHFAAGVAGLLQLWVLSARHGRRQP